MWRRGFLLIAVPGLAFLMTGCGGSGGGKNAPPNQHIMKFWSLKTEYAAANKGKQPSNTEELKAWAKNLTAQELAKMGIDNLDGVLVSPRDKEEYQIAPPPQGRQFGPPRVVVYEKTGVNGKRIVAGGTGEVYEMDEEKFNQALGRK